MSALPAVRPARTSARGRLHGRIRSRLWAVSLAAALALVASGCDGTPIVGDDGTEPTVLVVSDAWVSDQQGTGGGQASGGDGVQARISDLQEAVTDLRADTGTGWIGRQDDVTGYLSEVTGGSWPGEPAAFMEEYGARLFGVDDTSLRLGEPDTETIPGLVSTKADQVVGDVPVRDATMAFTSRDGRLTELRGRLFPGLRVDTVPTVTAEQAAAIAAQQAGGASSGLPTLVVVPRDAGVLTWQVSVVAVDAGTSVPGYYYVDATSGDVVDVRAASADLAAPVPGAASFRARLAHTRVTTGSGLTQVGALPLDPEANSVELNGTDSVGRELTAYGLQVRRGIQLVDTTTDAYDQATGTGAIRTYDASAVRNDGELPGELIVSKTPTVNDPEAMAAHTHSRAILDYYASLGRDSWDGAGGDLVSSVNIGADDFCNAYFIGNAAQPQMVYGNPCVIDGVPQSNSLVETDVAAHEVTHGVTDTTARLLYTGQSGALNESFSDYFGNIIGDLDHGEDSVAFSEDVCSGVTTETALCTLNPDGSRSLRYMLNGNDFDQYLRVLNPGLRLQILLGYDQDYGGVHYNSAIWNNALWSIRTRLAQIDGEPGVTSPLAKAFDRAVYGALATRLTPTSGFLEARAAVEQVIVDSQLDPTVIRVAREVFDAEKICSGCPDTEGLAGDSVSTAPQTQQQPKVSGDAVAWLDLSASSEQSGYAATTTLGGGAKAPRLLSDGDAADVAFAGQALLVYGVDGSIERIAPDGTTTRLDSSSSVNTQAAGLGGSDQGGAWLAQDGVTVRYVDADGTVSSAAVTGLGGDTVTAVAAGGGSVAVGTDQGGLFTWTPGSGQFAQVGQVDGAVISLATYAGTVFAITDSTVSTLVTPDGTSTEVTDRAIPFGATMSEEYVVWPEATGPVDVGTAPGGSSGFPETDLFLLSLETGKIYNLLPSPAQQGFPSISGRSLVWQDSALGGDDVFSAEVPGGL